MGVFFSFADLVFVACENLHVIDSEMQGCLNQNNHLDKLCPQNIFSPSIKKAVI